MRKRTAKRVRNRQPTKCDNEQKTIKIVKALGQKSCRTKVSQIFRIFVPNFAPNFAPNFSRIFRRVFVLRFVGDGEQKKFTKNPRHFSMQNSQANTKKIFTEFFWRAGKVTKQAKSYNKKKRKGAKTIGVLLVDWSAANGDLRDGGSRKSEDI